MKNINPLGFFDDHSDHFLLEKLTKLKDPLVKLDEHVDWNIFAQNHRHLTNSSKDKNL